MEKKLIILAVEDDVDLQDLNVVALTSKGFEVLEAKNGREAMEWLSRKGSEIRLVLLDIVMPVMDGFEVLEAMKKKSEYKNIPVVICSNLENDADRQAAFALGANEYFEKVKINPGKMAERIAEILAVK